MRQVSHSLLTAGLVSAACSGIADNEQGDLAAHKTGSIVTDLAPREDPESEFLARCGDGAPSESGKASLERLPFLQQVTSEAALVVFRAQQEPADVDVSTFDGLPVATVRAELDPSVADGSQQLARLHGLEPGHGYCYAVRGLTAPAGFRAAPSAGYGQAVRFAALGDSGWGGADQQALLEQMRTVPFDFIVHTGDLAYDTGKVSELARTVFRPYAELLRSFAIYPVTGNHDYGSSDADPFLQAFVLPTNGDSERWYSFDWGDAHFVALDTEQMGPLQADWLDADLMSNRLPWTIVYGHRPPFSSGEHGSSDGFRKYFVPVLEKYQVPLVLSGHDHDYERTKALNGVTYVVTGGGGRGTRPVGQSSFTAFSEAVIHFVFVEIAGTRLVLHAIDGTGREFDQAVIERAAG